MRIINERYGASRHLGPMTLAVFGLTGRTGLALAEAARAPCIAVQGLTRESRQLAHLPEIRLVRGTFADADRVAEVVAGADAVCCVIGPRPPSREAFCAAATAAIIAAMPS